MGLRTVLSEVALAGSARGAGAYSGGPVAAAGVATHAVLLVHCTAVTGTPTLDASLEESTDGATWVAITGSSITQLTGTGNRVAHGVVTRNYVRVTSTVAGTTPNMTYSATIFLATAG
jgi:hypothetical protein